MKTSNIQTSHNQAIVRGWVDPVSAGTDSSGGTGGGGGSVGQVENGAGADLTAGTVVVLAADGTFTTTTTAQDTRPVGVVLDDIAAGDFGPVAWSGPVALVNVTAAVTAGYYAETSTTAGQATQNATQRAGSFGYFTSSGTSPSAFLSGGASAATGSSSSITGDGLVPYYIPVAETYTVPIYRQALFYEAIEVDGALVVNGLLQGVD